MHTHTTESINHGWLRKIRREKWGNSAIVTRYRLDSQFHCSYLESRGVPGKNAGEKTREIISLSFPVHDFRWLNFRWRHFRWCNFRWRHIRWRHCSPLLPLKCVWAVPIYYCHISYGWGSGINVFVRQKLTGACVVFVVLTCRL